MLIKIINLLLGFVDFTFSGGFADGFINDCYNQKINVKNTFIRIADKFFYFTFGFNNS